VLVSFLRERIEEAVTLDGTPTVVGISKNRQALEAELRHAAPAHHLVALLPLRPLRGEVLLAHTHLALWALLGARAPHPAHEARVGGLGPLLPTPQLSCIRLTRKTLMIRRDPTAKAPAHFATRAISQPIVTILNLEAHVTTGCWASMKV